MFHELCHFVKTHSLYIPPTQCNYYSNQIAFLKTYSERSFEFSDTQFTLWMNILHLPHSLFCSVFIWSLFIYYIYYKHKLWRIFTLLETLPSPHNPFFKLLSISYLSFFVRDYVNYKVFEKVEPYLKILHPLLCVNLPAAYVL